MPKMPEEFYAQKREEILDAAQRIVLEKPLPNVTMKDLIRACGVSQGAIYHYFSGLDEIWLALIDRFYRADDVVARLQQVFAQQLPPRETAVRCLWALCENLRLTIPIYGKLMMELNTLVQANPAQYNSLTDSDAPRGRLDEMLSLFASWYEAQVAAALIHPRVGMEQLTLHLASTYLGLRYHAASLHLQPAPADMGLDAYLELQRDCWQVTVLYLLGLEAGNENKQEKG